MVYIVYTNDKNRNADEEEYARANDIVEARKLAVRMLERNHRSIYSIYIAQVDRYDNNAYPWQNVSRGRIVGYVSVIYYVKHCYQVWVPQNGKQKDQKVMYRDGSLYMTIRQFDKFMGFHIDESLEW